MSISEFKRFCIENNISWQYEDLGWSKDTYRITIFWLKGQTRHGESVVGARDVPVGMLLDELLRRYLRVEQDSRLYQISQVKNSFDLRRDGGDWKTGASQ